MVVTLKTEIRIGLGLAKKRQRSRRMAVTALFLAATRVVATSSKSFAADASSMRSTAESAAPSAVDADVDIAALCQSNPERCTGEALIRERFGAMPCSQLWTSNGDNIFAFDQYSSQYHRTQQLISRTHEVKMGSIGMALDTRAIADASIKTLESQLVEVIGPPGAKRLNWRSLPIGWEASGFGLFLPKFYALRVQNGLLGGREEWTIFRASVPPNLKHGILGQRTVADVIRDEVASFCVPVRTHVESAVGAGPKERIPLRQVIETLNEADDLKSEVKNWDRLYDSMVTFVEAAPGTGQVAAIYHGCYLKDKSCARALLVVAADAATYYVLAPSKYTAQLGHTTYMAVAAVGAFANLGEGGLLVKDSIHAAKQGETLQSVLLGGAAVLRFSAATGLAIDLIHEVRTANVEAMVRTLKDGPAGFGREAKPVNPKFIESYELKDPDVAGVVEPNPTLRFVSRGQEPVLNENGATLWITVERGGATDLRVGKELMKGGQIVRPDGTVKLAKFGHCTLWETPGENPPVFAGGEVRAVSKIEEIAGQQGIGRMLAMDNNSGRYSKPVGDTEQALVAAGKEMAARTGAAVRLEWFDWVKYNAWVKTQPGGATINLASPTALGTWLPNGRFVTAGFNGIGVPLPPRVVRDDMD